jgi:YD repeat-containing protein
MKNILWLFCITTLTFGSCKKDDTNNNNENKKQAKKIIKTEAGVNTVYNLAYDNNKRLVSVISADNTDKTIFTYDAAGNVTAMEILMPDNRAEWSFTYQGSTPKTGRYKAWDRSSGTEHLMRDDQLTYTVVNDKVTAMRINVTGPLTAVLDMNVEYEGANPKRIVSQTQGFAFTQTLTWGTKKSPFAPVFKYVLDWSGAHALYSSKNELISLQTVVQGGTSVTVNNQYTYDAEGYPLTITEGATTYRFEY